MSLTNYDPYWITEWNKMIRDMDRSLGRVFSDIKNIEAFPVVDVTDVGKEVVVHAELPGISKENIKVELLGDMLTISGHGSENKDYETASGWIRERRCGSFTRRLPIPRGVDVDKVETKFEDGLLELRIPRSEGAEPVVKKIDVQ
ncbi:9861_t:CDS:2 [Paraglomus brasilianum]|uniref:9861_t:CDS:1 n=1 Tax=Paraglomus brasilianum TaxID=144538 RepID=A0A9N9FWK5_9GLOM|nr:9861_t:CDS:2 [Paraglomus brasilianum]